MIHNDDWLTFWIYALLTPVTLAAVVTIKAVLIRLTWNILIISAFDVNCLNWYQAYIIAIILTVPRFLINVFTLGDSSND